MNKKPLAYVFALLAFAAPMPCAAEMFIQPNDFIVVFDGICRDAGNDIADVLKTRAAAERWDAMQRSPAATPDKMAWIMAIGGAPVVIDIARPAPGRINCSVSALTSAPIVRTIISERMRVPPKYKSPEGLQTGSYEGWSMKRPGRSNSVLVLSQKPGKPMARLTLQAGASAYDAR